MQRESNWRNYFTIAITLLCLMLILPTLRYGFFIYTTPEPELANFKAEAEYLVAKEKYDSDKKDLQRNAITLGLDLIGGVDVQLKIDRPITLARLLEKQRDALISDLNERQINAKVQPNAARDRLILAPDDEGDADQIISILDDSPWDDIFDSFDQDLFRSEGEIELALLSRVLNAHIDDAVGGAEKKIRDRVDEFGLTLPSVSRQGTEGILVQIPGVSDSEHVVKEIIRPAQLQFYALYNDPKGTADPLDVGGHNKKVAELFEYVEWPRTETTGAASAYIRVAVSPNGEMAIGWKLKEGMTLPTGHIALPGRELTAEEEAERSNETPVGQVYIVERDIKMRGDDLRDASMRTNPADLTDPIYVSVTFGHKGAREFHALSRDYLKKCVAIALDQKVYSAPVFQSVIPGGQGQITGNFSPEAAHELALVLKAGSFSADLKVTADREIGPTLGAESIRKSTTALLIGAACVTVFMLIYYGVAGIISVVALILNVLVIFGCLDMFNATLTLSGIGGMILTLGMAVDANVLIYERIREEINGGRDLVNAIRSGFGRAFSVILDSNLTTLLAAFVLLQFGEGSVQGFALTMAFGLLANLFTGLTVTFALCTLWFAVTGKLNMGSLQIARNTKFDFIHTRRLTFPLSVAMVVAAVVILIANGGPNMAVDFESGVVTEARINPIDAEGKADKSDQSDEIKKALAASGLSEQAKVQRIVNEDSYIIRVSLLSADAAPTTSTVKSAGGDVTYTQDLVKDVLEKRYPKEGEMKILSKFSVSPEVGQEFAEIAIMVIIAASICILIYLWFRFELVFGMAAVLALVHDLTITLGVITLLDIQISLDIVSALLILLGFSVNDTIVIFDRIRENSHSLYGKTFKEICNSAMNQSLSRTIITSFTTVGVMLIMYFFGGHSLAPFAMTLIVGGIIGTYSSDFLATPFVFWWNERDNGKLVKHLDRKNAGTTGTETKSAPATRIGAAPSVKSAAAPGQPRRRGRR